MPAVSRSWGSLGHEWTFGAVDGLNGSVGLIVGMLAAHAATPAIVAAVLASAAASTVSMAGAQYEADDDVEATTVRWARVGAMGVGYLTASILPAIGFFLSRSAGKLLLPLVAAVMLGLIATGHTHRHSWPAAIAGSVIIFALAVTVGVAAGLLVSN